MSDFNATDSSYTEFIQDEQAAGGYTDMAVANYIDAIDYVCTDALQKGQTADRVRLFAALVGKLEGKALEIASDLMKEMGIIYSEIDAEDKSVI